MIDDSERKTRLARGDVISLAALLVVIEVVVWCAFAAGVASKTNDVHHNPAAKSLFGDVSEVGCGKYYLSIAAHGYGYDPRERSTVAFFPGYPMLITLTGRAIRNEYGIAALVVSGVARVIAVVLLYEYTTRRLPYMHPKGSFWVAASMMCFPTTVFWHGAYSESLFVCIAIGAFLLMEANMAPLLIAVLIGFACGTRPVGVALIPTFMLYLYSNYQFARLYSVSGVVLVLTAAWGLLAFAFDLAIEFGDPIAFVRTQQFWALRENVSLERRIMGLMVLEPLWSVYMPSSHCYWGRTASGLPWFLSLQFWNPVCFTLSAVLVVNGWRTRLLNWQEVLTAFLLMAIPYGTRGFEMCMAGQGRFCGVVFPIYIVIGAYLSSLRPIVAWGILGVQILMLGTLAFLFAAGYFII